MKFWKQQWKDSLRELENIRSLAVTAMMVAAGIVLGFMATVQISDYLRIGFSFIPKELTAMLFGPVVGGIMGGATDILSFIMKPTGPYFFGFTFNVILSGVIYGVAFYHRPMTFRRILVTKAIVALLVNLILGTLWLSILYGNAFWVMIPARAVKQLISVPVETFIFYVTVQALSKAKVLGLMKHA